MIGIDLQQIANQEFIRIEDNTRYKIKLRTFHNLTLADIYINDEPVKQGVRCVANEPLIPYNYLTKGGNFMFVCPDYDYPYYKKFGLTQSLVYLTNKELEEIYG